MKKKIIYGVVALLALFAVLAYFNRDALKQGWEDGKKAAMEQQIQQAQ